MPGLLAAAKQGRNGDTLVGHLTPGEIVIPREVSALRPDLVAHVASGIKGMGMDPSKYVVGNGRINPKTGAEEFATEEEVRAAYQQTLGRDADAGGLAYWMNNDEGFRNGGFAAGAQQEIAARGQSNTGSSSNSGWGGAGSSASGSGGGLIGSASQPSTQPSSTDWGSAAAGGSSVSGSGASGANVNDWYRNVLGRDADQAGLDYWNSQMPKYQSAQDAYGAFVAGANANHELVKNMDYGGANSVYQGLHSDDGRNLVDDWARNTLGRAATAEEYQLYAGANGNNQAAYDAFVKAAQARGENIKGMDLYQASQLPTAPGKFQPDGAIYKPNLTQSVTADQTIEGRLNNVLGTDANGNYTNQVVRQAVERAQQSFAARGLLNSSMAQQAGQEAAISKAIEIVGPDAQRFFEQSRANQDATNTFARDWQQQQYQMQNQSVSNNAQMDLARLNNQAAMDRDQANNSFNASQKQNELDTNLRQNYINQLSQVTHTYQQMVDTINNSAMRPEDKTAAIANAARIRDSESAFVNNMFSQQPNWKNEWLTMAVSTQGLDINSIGNIDTLSAIISDPAQSANIRSQATKRRDQLMQEMGTPPASTAPADPLAAANAYGGWA